MDRFIRDRNITVVEDTIVFGHQIKKGSKITIVSTAGEYNGFKMRVPPPEFEALFFDHALSAALVARNLKKQISIITSDFDGMPAIENTDKNYLTFFEFSQNFMASIAFTLSALESWVNNTIQSHVDEKNQPVKIEIEVEQKGKKRTISELNTLIPNNRDFSISRKIFRVIPKILNVKELSEHNKLRKELNDLVEERNIIMHMQDDAQQRNKINFAVSMYKRDDFYPIDLVLQYWNKMYYGTESMPMWISDMIKRRDALKNIR